MRIFVDIDDTICYYNNDCDSAEKRLYKMQKPYLKEN